VEKLPVDALDQARAELAAEVAASSQSVEVAK
jgi:hypothetical protein